MQFSLPGFGRSRIFAWLAMVPAGAVLLGVALQAPGDPVRALVNCETSTAAMDQSEQDVLALINAERAKLSLGPLTASPSLARAAAWKSADKSATGAALSHTDSLGRDYLKRMQDCGHPAPSGWTGEIIAYGQPTAASVVSAWMQSPGHKARILDGRYLVAGVGRIGNAWTVVFGQINDAGSQPPTSVPATSTPTKTATTAPTQTPTSTSTPTTAPPTATPTQSPTATPSPYPENEVRLARGFNLVTYAGNNGRAPLRFEQLGSKLISAYLWDAEAGRWRTYMPSAPGYVNTLEELNPLDILFIQVAEETTWLY